MNQEEFAIALSTGMGAAAEVARRAGHVKAAECITAYERDWWAKVRPAKVREMQQLDVCPDAGRYATAEDFGLPAIAIEAASADKTGTGLAEGESAGRQASPKNRPDNHPTLKEMYNNASQSNQ